MVDTVVHVASTAELAGLIPARQQMAPSRWHIILARFGVAFPAIIFGPLREPIALRWSWGGLFGFSRTLA